MAKEKEAKAGSNSQGWIKLYRSVQDNPIYRKSQYVHLWVHLLLKANHKKSEFIWNGKRMVLIPGQLLTGRLELSRETKIPPSTIEKILKYLKREHQIEQQTTTKFRIITIKNWDFYQSNEKENIKKDNSVTTKEQQRDINKNVKEYKRMNKKYSRSSDELRLSTLLYDLIHKRDNGYKKPNLQAWAKNIGSMVRLDNRKPDEIERVIRWSQADDFWQVVILSTKSLRKNFDTLRLQSQGRSNSEKQRTRAEKEAEANATPYRIENR